MTNEQKRTQQLEEELAETQQEIQRLRDLVGQQGQEIKILRRSNLEMEFDDELKLLRTVIDNIPDSVFVEDKSGRFVLINHAFAMYLGLSAPQEVIGKTVFDFYPTELAQGFRTESQAVLSSARPLMHQVHLITNPPGQQSWRIISKIPLKDAQGRVIGLVGISRDITSQKHTEEQLIQYRDHFEELAAARTAEWIAANERLLQQIVQHEWTEEELKTITQRYELAIKAGKVGVWDWDLWSGEFYLDPILETMLGFENQEIRNLDDWISHVHLYDAARVSATVKAHFEGGTPIFELEHRVLDKHGNIRWFLVRGSTILDENKKPYRLIATNTDITEYKRADEALQVAHLSLSKKAADLEVANRELGQYAYVVSHDLKAPLRAIHNYADFLTEDLQDKLDDEQGEYLAGLLEAVHEAEALVDDLLELSRIGRRNVPIERIDLTVFLQDLVTTLDIPAEVQFELADNWPTIEAELSLIRQIFQNLIQNGLKFNQSSPKRISMGWRSIDKDFYEFFVQDNGIGIESQFQDRIFDVFQRLHTNDEYPGTGIGLAIVKKAAENLQGSIRVESAEDQGSTFFVTLPRKQKEE